MSQKRKITPEHIRCDLAALIDEFEVLSKSEELRPKVLHLVSALKKLRDLGKAVMPIEPGNPVGAKFRILSYLKSYTGQVISGDELLIVSGIQEYARRVRELRVELGWPVVSGIVIKELVLNGEIEHINVGDISPDSYMLLSDSQDRDAAFRWNLANTIRKEKGLAVRDRILKYLRANVGKFVSGEELRYVSGNKTEWARRVRELRTEAGWPIFTRNSGRTDLKIGSYILEEDRQSQIHDRQISDSTRVTVLERDGYSCRKCSWVRDKLHRDDPRKFLELHHVIHHIRKGENEVNNLITLCNVCHDLIHKLDREQLWNEDDVNAWLKS